MPDHVPLSESDEDKSPDYLRGRQDGLAYAALVIDGYIQRVGGGQRFIGRNHLERISNALKFGTQMLDLTDGKMPPTTPEDHTP